MPGVEHVSYFPGTEWEWTDDKGQDHWGYKTQEEAARARAEYEKKEYIEEWGVKYYETT